MKKLLTNLTGMKVLLIGSGTGEETEILEEVGATDITGIDISQVSVKLANQAYPKFNFLVGDMHKLEFGDDEFDLVYSSLTIHYTSDREKVFREVLRVLKPGGTFQFSVGHPMRWSSERVSLDGVSTKLIGFSEEKEHPRLYGKFMDFDQFSEEFPTGQTLSFWIGPPSREFKLLKEAGFTIEEFIESQAVEETKAVDQYYYERYSQYPQFAIFVARKPSIPIEIQQGV